MILFAHRHPSYSSYSLFLRHFWNLINKIRRIFCQVQIYQQYVTCIRIKKKDDLAVNINFDSVITKVRLKREWKSEGKKKKGREKRKVYPRKITFSSRNCGWMQISAMGTIINGEQRKEVAGRKRGRRKKKSFNKETDRPTRPSRWRDSNPLPRLWNSRDRPTFQAFLPNPNFVQTWKKFQRARRILYFVEF